MQYLPMYLYFKSFTTAPCNCIEGPCLSSIEKGEEYGISLVIFCYVSASDVFPAPSAVSLAMNMNVAGLSADKVSVGSQGYGHISRLMPHRKVMATSPVQILCSVCSHIMASLLLRIFLRGTEGQNILTFMGF